MDEKPHQNKLICQHYWKHKLWGYICGRCGKIYMERDLIGKEPAREVGNEDMLYMRTRLHIQK